jgi:uncharacterized membrane protein
MASIDSELAPPGTRIAPRRNLEPVERGLSVAAGTMLGLIATRQKGAAGAMLGVVGSLLVARGVTGASPITRLLGQAPDERDLAKAQGWSSAALVSRSVTINAARHIVYERLRNFAAWPDFALNIKRVEILDDNRSRWFARDPAHVAEWTARLVEDRPGDVIALASEPGTPVPLNSRFTLRDAPGGRGTEIHATIAYCPPGGSLGRYAAKLTQREPGIQLRRDLKRLKSLIETGEIATNAPQGTEPKA